MTRRTLTGFAALALCFLAATARAQQPGAAPAEVTPVAAPAADAPPADALPADATPLVVPALPGTPAPAAGPPMPIVTQAPARGSLAHRWWFWAGLGAAAVGLVVAAIALSPPQPYQGNASPGLITPF